MSGYNGDMSSVLPGARASAPAATGTPGYVGGVLGSAQRSAAEGVKNAVAKDIVTAAARQVVSRIAPELLDGGVREAAAVASFSLCLHTIAANQPELFRGKAALVTEGTERANTLLVSELWSVFAPSLTDLLKAFEGGLGDTAAPGAGA